MRHAGVLLLQALGRRGRKSRVLLVQRRRLSKAGRLRRKGALLLLLLRLAGAHTKGVATILLLLLGSGAGS